MFACFVFYVCYGWFVYCSARVVCVEWVLRGLTIRRFCVRYFLCCRLLIFFLFSGFVFVIGAGDTVVHYLFCLFCFTVLVDLFVFVFCDFAVS